MGYSITPISLETGIISWVENCDTIGEIIHKERSSSVVFLERQISREICQFYHILPKAQKV
jgi:phosphatidylinositol kinase/protein kinase (PI-3  family)